MRPPPGKARRAPVWRKASTRSPGGGLPPTPAAHAPGPGPSPSPPPAAPPTPRAHGPRPRPSPPPPPSPPLHPQLADPLHQTLTHLLVAGSLDRREIAGHLSVLILLDLEHLCAARLHPIHQLAHAVGVRRDARLHLILERATAFHLLLHDIAPAGAKPFLRRTQLGRLVLREIQVLLHAASERRLDLRAQPSRFHGVSLLSRKTRRKEDDQAE